MTAKVKLIPVTKNRAFQMFICFSTLNPKTIIRAFQIVKHKRIIVAHCESIGFKIWPIAIGSKAKETIANDSGQLIWASLSLFTSSTIK